MGYVGQVLQKSSYFEAALGDAQDFLLSSRITLSGD